MILPDGYEPDVTTYMLMLLQPGYAYALEEFDESKVFTFFGFGPVPAPGADFVFGIVDKRNSQTTFRCSGIIPPDSQFNQLPIPLVVVQRNWIVSTTRH